MSSPKITTWIACLAFLYAGIPGLAQEVRHSGTVVAYGNTGSLQAEGNYDEPPLFAADGQAALEQWLDLVALGTESYLSFLGLGVVACRKYNIPDERLRERPARQGNGTLHRRTRRQPRRHRSNGIRRRSSRSGGGRRPAPVAPLAAGEKGRRTRRSHRNVAGLVPQRHPPERGGLCGRRQPTRRLHGRRPDSFPLLGHVQSGVPHRRIRQQYRRDGSRPFRHRHGGMPDRYACRRIAPLLPDTGGAAGAPHVAAMGAGPTGR